MGQEFFIKSSNLESKIRELLPSQGGLGAGFDLSASTQIIPVVDLTESASGSNLRADLQKAVDNATTNTVASNTTQTAISNTGFYQVHVQVANSTSGNCFVEIFDGVTANNIRIYRGYSALTRYAQDDFIVFLSAGLSLRITSSNSTSVIETFTRQIADINGNLTNPLNF
tara:strand:- start:204 stop:713 length:510 start_codon:yes stop_codon:yes gene_type:complete